MLPAIIRACEAGAHTILVPAADLPEAIHAPHGTSVLGASSLAAAVAWLRGTGAPPERSHRQPYTAAPPPGPDLAEATASPRARRSLEIAAAGGHSLLLVGQDGGGASALARYLPGLLPDLTHEEVLEVAAIRLAAGIHDPHPHPVITRPFRAPSDEVAPEAFTGGGRDLRPGELTLAHHGVLFLDELPLYRRSVMDTLRQPLQHGWVQVRHGRHTLRLPARFLLAASGTPWEGMAHPLGPHARRMDLAVDVGPTRAKAAGSRESSAVVCARVTAARRRQLDRGETLNAHLPVEPLIAHFPRSSQAWHTASDTAFGKPNHTIGHLHSLLRVARTIADLEGNKNVEVVHVLEAAGFLPDLTPTPTARSG